MMTITTLMQAVIGLGSFAALIVILYGPWQEICTDFARQIVFEKRDAIFDLAHSGKLSFKSREYGTIRSSLQASIRFAHELSLPRFLVTAAGLRKQGSHPEDNELSRAIRQISDPVTRNQVGTLVNEAYRALFLMMVAKSPVMLLLFVVMLPGLIVLRYLPIPGKTIQTRVREIEPRARGYIQLEAEAA
jgi:hypothetical protein